MKKEENDGEDRQRGKHGVSIRQNRFTPGYGGCYNIK